MSRTRFGNLAAAIRAPFCGNPNIPVPFPSNAANTSNVLGHPEDWAWANTFECRAKNAAGTDDVHMLSCNASNQVLIAEEMARAARQHVSYSQYVTATIVTGVFATFPTGYRVTGATFILHVAGSSTGATKPTVYVEHLTGTQAPGSGAALTSTVDCHAATADTLQTMTLLMPTTGDSDDPNLLFSAGDRMGIVVAGTTTALAGVEITVTLAPYKGELVTVSIPLNADIPAAMAIFTANRPYVLTAVSYSHSTAGTDASAVTMQITNDASGTAPGAGTALLTNASNVGFNCKGAINTVQVGALTATAASLRLALGAALSFSITGTKTALAGICVTLTLQTTSSDRINKTFSLYNVDGAADLTGLSAQNLWTADRDYEIVDLRERHAVVAGQAGTMNVYVDTGTTAPGGGQAIATSNFDMTATANTAVAGTLPVLGLRFLLAGDRLSVKSASGSLASAKGAQITVSLQPR